MGVKKFFIAEIGINHGGSFTKAMRMVLKAAKAGASAVKFQKYNPVKVLGPNSPYLKDAHQLSWPDLRKLCKYAHSLGLLFGCSVFDSNDVVTASRFVDFHKIATRMNEDRDFIKEIMSFGMPTFMSIQNPKQQIHNYPIVYLWCVPKYPSSSKECLKFNFDDRHGLSSHCPDKSVMVDAFMKGARVFENHVCESLDESGCDIPASLNFEDYAAAIHEINAFS